MRGAVTLATGLIAAALIVNTKADKPAAVASYAPVAIDNSAELAAKDAVISELRAENEAMEARISELAAAQVAEPDAPAAVARPAGVLQTSLPRHHLSSPQCAGGACGVQPAMQQRRYAAPVRQRRVFGGRLFGRR